MFGIVTGVIGAVAGGISTALGGAIGGLATGIAKLGIDTFSIIGSVIRAIAEALGFIEPEEEVEDIGDRALQAQEDGITLESCDGDYEKYMQKLRDFKLDPEKSKDLSPEAKNLAGFSILGSRIEQQYGTSLEPLFPIIMKSPDFFSGERVKSMLDTGLSAGKISDYFSGGMTIKERNPVENLLVASSKQFAPGTNDSDILQSLRDKQS